MRSSQDVRKGEETIRYTANYERTAFQSGRVDGDRKAENALLFRAQVAF